MHFFPFTLLTSLPAQDHAPEEIVKIPSASAIDIVRRSVHTTRPAYALAIFADPVFDDLDSRVTAHDALTITAVGSLSLSPSALVHTPGNSLPRLRYTLQEAHAISQLFPQNQSRCLSGNLPPPGMRPRAMRSRTSGSSICATHSLPDETTSRTLRKSSSHRVTEHGIRAPASFLPETSTR